jgi:hypothetical protein
VRLFRDVLDGRLEAAGDRAAELTWRGGKRIKLVREDGLPMGGALHHIGFTRAQGAFTAQDRQRASLLAKRLGLLVSSRLAIRRPERGWCHLVKGQVPYAQLSARFPAVAGDSSWH